MKDDARKDMERALIEGSARRVDPANYVNAYTTALLAFVAPLVLLKARDLHWLLSDVQRNWRAVSDTAPWEVGAAFASLMAAGATKRLFGAEDAARGAVTALLLVAPLAAAFFFINGEALLLARASIAQKAPGVVAVVLTLTIVIFYRLLKNRRALPWVALFLGAITYIFGATLGAFPELRLHALFGPAPRAAMAWHIVCDVFFGAALAAALHVRRTYGARAPASGD
ncbi:MAG: hypothetical protein AAF645_19300 [Myxococcota bacterium]